MTLQAAQLIIECKAKDGSIPAERVAWFEQMVRRTGDYGNIWSWHKQATMRANLLNF